MECISMKFPLPPRFSSLPAHSTSARGPLSGSEKLNSYPFYRTLFQRLWEELIQPVCALCVTEHFKTTDSPSSVAKLRINEAIASPWRGSRTSVQVSLHRVLPSALLQAGNVIAP